MSPTSIGWLFTLSIVNLPAVGFLQWPKNTFAGTDLFLQIFINPSKSVSFPPKRDINSTAEMPIFNPIYSQFSNITQTPVASLPLVCVSWRSSVLRYIIISCRILSCLVSSFPNGSNPIIPHIT